MNKKNIKNLWLTLTTQIRHGLKLINPEINIKMINHCIRKYYIRRQERNIY